MSIIPSDVRKQLLKQKYHIVGAHSAVKKCRWLHKSLVENKACYKEKFYGIRSHRCVQCTPAVIWCPNYCVYCWRVMPQDVGLNWDPLGVKSITGDEPEVIFEGFLREQRRILSGYNPEGNRKVDKVKWLEAQDPKHFAISLSGEPLLYNRINELIEYIKNKGKTVFLVTNGQEPERLAVLNEPTQLYISLSAPNKEVFKRTCRPTYPDGWQRLQRSLELLSTFKCPTVLRLTLVKDINMVNPEGYAESILKSNCHYVEVKAAMFVGGSLFRMRFENMPRHSEIKEFAEKLADLTGYYIIDEVLNSRVVLLSRVKKH
ncbi:MAG: 4-demethylwyosine synthase TYW1 [Candidatus Odinarchaeum yellowstonii]|uniref:S-adenosyl-L-methionine-dependent tRNA 4-demethylwyosine synthase n=1 Tax=Odinarchaeota yellowstonii (strain LCB_4) TaxID=1841599 RepID=A0AAF0D3N9_ODILC|nr:MAG: 4-demethylwyosine synthase TYW1 [Candidatus Odinarchaeum yellowstonii]